jgi:hypothetical protein
MMGWFKKDLFITTLVLVSLLSLLRSVFIPLQGDEITYNTIANNILSGRYYLSEYPSTVTPIIPFFIALFSISIQSSVGIILAKLTNIVFALVGFRFLFLFLKKQSLDIKIILSLVLLSLTNTHSIAWFSSLYPESILFMAFWGFVFYFFQEFSVQNFNKMLCFFGILVLTRYLYAILIIPVFWYYFKVFKFYGFKDFRIKKILLYSILIALPVIFWFKYVYLIEQQNLSEISYFNRFNNDFGIVNNIKAGLGLIKHPEVSRINGIPAFVSIFIPVTGLRHFLPSIVLLIAFLVGWYKSRIVPVIFNVLGFIVLIMLGLILAGTGFSRYWLVLLPGFYISFYFLYKSFNFSDQLFFKLSNVIALVYVVNELRLDYLILNNHL